MLDRLVFIGFMGAGKSAAGRALARDFAWKFFDMDVLVQVLSGVESINEIFEKYGETHFRNLEMKAAENICAEKQAVISTGGGVVMNDKIMSILKTPETCIVYIKVSFNELEKRLEGKTNRPLFRDKEKAKALYDTRLSYYEKYADVIVETDGYTPSEAAEKIIKTLKQEGWLDE